MTRVAVLLTCHNRQTKTLACLDALFQCTLADQHTLDVFLVDDGCSDGTAAAVNKSYPLVNIIEGDGNLFWNGGMRMAYAAAMDIGFDFYLWLNDDTLLYQNAVQELVSTSHDLQAQHKKNIIVVGSTRDTNDGRLTYGGLIRPSKWKATTFTLLPPRDVPVECDTMNGNCVLVPREIAEVMGNLDPQFTHAMGDLDYGLRARNLGFGVWVMPGFAGTCDKNAVANSFNDASLSVVVRLRRMMQSKGLPPAPWLVFTRRHVGIFWFIYWLWPYVKVIATGRLIE